MTFFSNLGTNLFSIFFTFFHEFFVGEISLEKRKTKFRIILFASLFFSYFYFASNSSFDYNALFRSIFFNQSFPLVLSFHLKLSLITNKVHSFRMNFRFFFSNLFSIFVTFFHEFFVGEIWLEKRKTKLGYHLLHDSPFLSNVAAHACPAAMAYHH